MIVFRLSKKKFCRDLSGKGAELAGGRWNSKGFAMLYTSESRALCLAEIAVHAPLGMIPLDYHLIEIEIPEIEIAQLDTKELPEDWHLFPHSSVTQNIGNKFIEENNALVLKVPSAVVHGDYNYLVNPGYSVANQLEIKNVEPFHFDERLFK